MDVYVIGYILIILGFLITFISSLFIKSNYIKYSEIANSKDLTGFDVARKILDSENLTSVHIVEVKGYLSDHYDPSRKVVRLSTSNFHENSIAALAVAAHEVGHAIQDKENYIFMRLRSLIVPFVNLVSKGGYIAIIIGILFGFRDIIYVAIAMEFAVLIFQLITLPVEFNASRKALEKLEQLNIVKKDDYNGAKKMLIAAAFTYVASLVTILFQLLRLVLIAGNRRD